MADNLNPNAFNFTAHRVREGQAKIVDKNTMEVVDVPPKALDVEKWKKEHSVGTITLVNTKGSEVKINSDDTTEIRKWRAQGFMTPLELEELLRPSAEVEAEKERLAAEAAAKAKAEADANKDEGDADDADEDGEDEEKDEKPKGKGKKNSRGA